MKRILLVLLVILGATLFSPLAAQQCKKQTKDSLLRVYLASQADSSRLEALHKIALLDQHSPTFIYYENKLLKEATEQNNLHYQSTAIYAHVAYYYNQLDEKRMELWQNRLEKLAKEQNFYEHYFKGKKTRIEFHIINEKVELALKDALQMYEEAKKQNNQAGMREAYLCQMTSYFNTLRYKEGLHALNQAVALINSDTPLSDQIDLLSKAVVAYSHLRDNKNLLTYLDQLKDLSAKDQAANFSCSTGGDSNLPLLIEAQYSLYYTRAQQPQKAWEHIQNAEKVTTQTSFLPYRLILLDAYTEYYQLTKNYEQALKYLEEAIKFVTPLSPSDAYIYGLQKADLLANMGRPDEAWMLYKKVTKAKDSLYTAFASSQIEQIQGLYNIDHLLLEQEERQSTFRRICLLVFIVIIIALILSNIHMYVSGKRLRKDEQEMRRLANIAEEANETKNLFLANMSYNIRVPLNNVVGLSLILSTETELSEEERKEYSGIIQSNSSELIQLVNDVLDLSRLEANMMKYQLQNCSIQEWCGELSYAMQTRNEGFINLQLEVEEGIEEILINTDVNRLVQMNTSMLLYPEDCKEMREVKMELSYRADKHLIACQIENSPMADPAFASQKISVRQKINQLFFEHFEGSFQVEEDPNGGTGIIIFTYPTVS